METIDREVLECEVLPDASLWRSAGEVIVTERQSLVSFLIRLGEIGHRKLHEKYGYSSLFRYCEQGLRLSRWEAHSRSVVAREGRRYRSVLTFLRAGDLNMTAAAALAPLLTSDNHESLLKKAKGLSGDQLERFSPR